MLEILNVSFEKYFQMKKNKRKNEKFLALFNVDNVSFKYLYL